MATPVLVFESHPGSGRGIENGTAGDPKGTTVRVRGRAVGWVPEKVTLNGPHCRMLEKRMVAKAVAGEESMKSMRRKGSICCEGAKEKRRNKNASDRAARSEKRDKDKVDNGPADQQ